MPGVTVVVSPSSVSAPSIKDRTVTVVEDPKVSDEQLINAIHKLEYTAEVVK